MSCSRLKFSRHLIWQLLLLRLAKRIVFGDTKMGLNALKSTLRSVTRLLICLCLLLSTLPAANARFISPDDMDPTLPGVGTNRYAYAGNDPVNKADPNGHNWFTSVLSSIASAIASSLSGSSLQTIASDYMKKDAYNTLSAAQNVVTTAVKRADDKFGVKKMREGLEKRKPLMFAAGAAILASNFVGGPGKKTGAEAGIRALKGTGRGRRENCPGDI